MLLLVGQPTQLHIASCRPFEQEKIDKCCEGYGDALLSQLHSHLEAATSEEKANHIRGDQKGSA